MKLTPWYLAAIAPIAVAGCSGAFLGQLAVLALTVGIFVGTLSLGRHAHDKGSSKASTTTQTHPTLPGAFQSASGFARRPPSGEQAPS
jgi:hypothetical protein